MLANIVNLQNGIEFYIPKPTSYRELGWQIYSHLNMDPWCLRILRVFPDHRQAEIFQDNNFAEIIGIEGNVLIHIRQIRNERGFFSHMSDYLKKNSAKMSAYLNGLYQSILSGTSVLEKIEMHKITVAESKELEMFLNFVVDIEEVDLQANKHMNAWLSEDSSHILGNRTHQLLKRLDLINKNLNQESVEVLPIVTKILQDTTSFLRYLNISYSKASPTVLKDLFVMIRHLEVLQVLNVSHNRLSEDLLHNLENSLNSIIPFRALECENCGLELNNFAVWNEPSDNSYWKRLRRLNLRGNKLATSCNVRDECAFYKCTRLEALDLSKCMLSSYDLNVILDCLPETMKYLNISENEEIVDTSKLRSFPNLHTICIQTKVGDFFWGQNLTIADFSASKTRFEELRTIQDNHRSLSKLSALYLGDLEYSKGVDSTYFGFLDHCRNLEDFSVNIDNNSYGELLLSQLQCLPRLKRLSLWKFQIDKEVQYALKSTLERLDSLEYFLFDSMNLNYDGCVNVLQGFLKHPSLKYVSINNSSSTSFHHKNALAQLQSYSNDIEVTSNMICFQSEMKLTKVRNLCKECGHLCNNYQICHWLRARSLLYLRYLRSKLRLI